MRRARRPPDGLSVTFPAAAPTSGYFYESHPLGFFFNRKHFIFFQPQTQQAVDELTTPHRNFPFSYQRFLFIAVGLEISVDKTNTVARCMPCAT